MTPGTKAHHVATCEKTWATMNVGAKACKTLRLAGYALVTSDRGSYVRLDFGAFNRISCKAIVKQWCDRPDNYVLVQIDGAGWVSFDARFTIVDGRVVARSDGRVMVYGKPVVDATLLARHLFGSTR